MSDNTKIECPHCGILNDAGSRFCENCGKRIAQQTKHTTTPPADVAPATSIDATLKNITEVPTQQEPNLEPSISSTPDRRMHEPKIKEFDIPPAIDSRINNNTTSPTYGGMPHIKDNFTYGRIFNESATGDSFEDESPIKLVCDRPTSMYKDVSTSYRVKLEVLRGAFTSVKLKMYLENEIASEIAITNTISKGEKCTDSFSCKPTITGIIPLSYELECIYEGTTTPEKYKSCDYQVQINGVTPKQPTNFAININADYHGVSADRAGDFKGGNINLTGLEKQFGSSDNSIFARIQSEKNVHIPLKAIKRLEAMTFLLGTKARLHIFTKEEVSFGRYNKNTSNDINLCIFNPDGTIDKNRSRTLSRQHFSIRNDTNSFSIKNNSKSYCPLLAGEAIDTCSTIYSGKTMELTLCPPPCENLLGLTIDTEPTNRSFCKQCNRKDYCVPSKMKPSSVVIHRKDNIPEIYILVDTCVDLGKLFPDELTGYLLTRTGNNLQLITPQNEHIKVIIGNEIAQGAIRILPLTQVNF